MSQNYIESQFKSLENSENSQINYEYKPTIVIYSNDGKTNHISINEKQLLLIKQILIEGSK